MHTPKVAKCPNCLAPSNLKAINAQLLEALEYTTAVLAGVMDVLPATTQASAKVQVEAAHAAIQAAKETA